MSVALGPMGVLGHPDAFLEGSMLMPGYVCFVLARPSRVEILQNRNMFRPPDREALVRRDLEQGVDERRHRGSLGKDDQGSQ